MKKGLKYFSDLINGRPYASAFNKNDAEDKRLMERNVAREWANSMKEAFGLDVSSLNEGDDPPDFVCFFEGHRANLELTELVDGKLKSEVVRRKRNGEVINTSSPDVFQRAQWDNERLVTEIGRLITRKSRIDFEFGATNILLIHSDEPWLLDHQIEDAQSKLSEIDFGPFDEVHVLLTYSPAIQRWPLFRILNSDTA